MTKVETATCQDCGWQGPVQETNEFRNVWDRVLPGDVMPAGECPAEGCGGAAMLDADHDGADDLRPQMVALMLGLDRLRDDLRNAALRSPIDAHLKELADYARRALASGPPIRPVCNACGGTSVQVDAWASWDVDAQRWQLHSTCEAVAICADCDLELHAEARHGGHVMQERSAFDFGGNRIVRQSEPMKIGKHEWRLTLYRSDHHDRPLIGYEWRRADGSPIRVRCPGGGYFLDGSRWMRDQDWPSYNHNDGEWGGMPRKLRKLWERCPWAHTRETRPA